MTVRQKFSDADLERIKASVRKAENQISGEIVPVVVGQSGYYSIANYKSGLIFGSLTFLLIIIFDRYVPALAVYDPLLIFITVMVAGIMGALIPLVITSWRRLLVAQAHLDHSTRQQAENAFLEEEVFNTRHRTGIMIFISFFEHEVIIMADRGISKVVDQKVWDKLVEGLINEIRLGKVVEGLEHTIKKCGDILLENGFNKTADDVNELRDDLRID
jgi:putative membrane protein